MNSKSFLFLAVFLALPGLVTAASQTRPNNPSYTLQVASFPNTDLANRFVLQLVEVGEHPVCATVELSGRGYWTRVFLGLFDTLQAAGLFGDDLVARGVISEFLVKKADLNQAATRPRTVTDGGLRGKEGSIASKSDLRLESLPVDSQIPFSSDGPTELPVLELPSIESAFDKAPSIDTAVVPRPDPILLAIEFITGESRLVSLDPAMKGGLWLSGDIDDGLSRLQWIVGDENAGMLTWDSDGRLRVDRHLLAKAAGLVATRVEDPLQAAAYIASNEGLLLIIQLAEGRYRYMLHVGAQAPTRGKALELSGGVNLDNNYDSRINPHRKHCEKLDIERPPEGFDSLVGLNPNTLWFNLRTNSLVPTGEITFHELAEAYAKLELSLDYLDDGSRSGAHAMALEREQRLQSQRPGAEIVLTTGSNLVLRTEQEIRLFYAEGPRGIGQR